MVSLHETPVNNSVMAGLIIRPNVADTLAGAASLNSHKNLTSRGNSDKNSVKDGESFHQNASDINVCGEHTKKAKDSVEATRPSTKNTHVAPHVTLLKTPTTNHLDSSISQIADAGGGLVGASQDKQSEPGSVSIPSKENKKLAVHRKIKVGISNPQPCDTLNFSGEGTRKQK